MDVLEIGRGGGGFAVRAATRVGCRGTTTPISDEQYRHLLVKNGTAATLFNEPLADRRIDRSRDADESAA